MKGVGCDLCFIPRMEKSLQNPRFLERVFSFGERERIERGGPASAAGIWAAKEACAKALGTGFREFTLLDIEVGWDDLGAPHLTLRSGAAERLRALGAARALVSISHDGELALAFCVIE